jgi:acyl carrier protein
MDKQKEFLEIVAKYSDKSVDEITMDMKFRDDLGFSSLTFMTFLGDLEDTFDVELDEEAALKITTIREALDYMDSLS